MLAATQFLSRVCLRVKADFFSQNDSGHTLMLQSNSEKSTKENIKKVKPEIRIKDFNSHFPNKSYSISHTTAVALTHLKHWTNKKPGQGQVQKLIDIGDSFCCHSLN